MLIRTGALAVLFVFALLAQVPPVNSGTAVYPSSGTILANLPAGNPFPTWTKITVANSGINFALTCLPATSLCGTTPVAKTAALTQSVTLLALPVKAHILGCVVKTSTAFTGTTTLTATVGITGTLTACVVTPFDLQAAVSNTNLAAPGLSTPIVSIAGTNAILALTSTVGNISAISAGNVDTWILWSVLP